MDGWNPINNGINHLSTGAGFLPSTLSVSKSGGLGLWWSPTGPSTIKFVTQGCSPNTPDTRGGTRCTKQNFIKMSHHLATSWLEQPQISETGGYIMLHPQNIWIIVGFIAPYMVHLPHTIWLVVDLPLWKMMEFVSWYYYSQLNGKIIHSCSKPPTRKSLCQHTWKTHVFYQCHWDYKSPWNWCFIPMPTIIRMSTSFLDFSPPKPPISPPHGRVLAASLLLHCGQFLSRQAARQLSRFRDLNWRYLPSFLGEYTPGWWF